MMAHESDPDVVRWGLQDLKVCTPSNAGCCCSVTLYQDGSVTHGCIREGYNEPVSGPVENDAVIAQLYQEELSKVAQAEAAGFFNPSRSSVIAQEWYHRQGQENHGRGTDDPAENGDGEDFGDMNDKRDSRTGSWEGENSPTRDFSPMDGNDSVRFIEIEEDSASLDGEVGKRLNHMVPVPHVPKINGEILPSEDEQISDHERLLKRLQLYDLVETKVQGDGNCQFRSLSDQLYRSPEHHKFVREQVVHQLASHREMYEGYVSMGYDDYLKKMRRNGEWGDHVTLQAAADLFGARIFVITSFKDTCYIEILPHIQKSNRLICLSFWAEVHYNSIYPEGELPLQDSKKKKKWWSL